MTPTALLLVRAGTRRVALALADLVEVVEPGPPTSVPARGPAVRGVTTVRGQLLPLVHLGALLDGRACPEPPGEAGVVVTAGGRRICLEVEAVEDVLREPPLPVPPGQALPWAAGVARGPDGPVPVLDVAAVGARLAQGER